MYLFRRCQIPDDHINPACAALDGRAGAVRIGSQADGAFLRDVVREMGGIDIVLDDGSHRMVHMRRSFDVLFPLLSEGGIYMVEDLHTAYWRAYGGAKARRSTFLNFARRLVDDMHHWYRQLPPEEPALSGMI